MVFAKTGKVSFIEPSYLRNGFLKASEKAYARLVGGSLILAI